VSVRRIHEEYDSTIRWRAFPLHPDIPPSGMDYRAYLGGEAGWQAGAERLGTMAATLGLPFRMPERKYNSRRADELTAWALTDFPEEVDELRTALFHAIWVDGIDNSDPAVLADVAASVGIPHDRAGKALEERTGTAAVDADWQESMARGVRGVPAVFIGETMVSGAQPWPVFAEALASAGVGLREP
jgi:predicted DsbA family dithiol-disulfide isomerase